jgi:C-terminal processing protease CtpA/Prc
MRRRSGRRFDFFGENPMKTLKIVLPVAAVLLLAGQVAAQNAEEERMSEMEVREAEFTKEMQMAEEQLAEAAQRVAELSQERLGALREVRKFKFDFSNKPRLGVNIESEEEGGPVEGVAILSVTPGSAADDAGMRAGDIITAVDGTSLTAESSYAASMSLLEIMKVVEEGDQLDVEYLRDGNVGTVQIEPRVVPMNAYAWSSDGGNFVMPNMPDMHASAEAIEKFRFSFGGWRGGWGDMEVVELTEELGRYFGTDSGLLVISAPSSNAFKLQEGDVIKNIDDREPSSVNHCMRILGSYQPGEKLVLNILRDKKPMKLEIEIPDDRTGMRIDQLFELVKPVRVVLPRPAPVLSERT